MDKDIIVEATSGSTSRGRLGLDENHGEKVEKSRHTFKKVAKFTANSRSSFINLKISH